VPEAYQTFMNEKNGFSKPFQFSKLVDELSNTLSISRHVIFWLKQNPTASSVKEATSAKNSQRRLSSRQITRHSFATTKNRKSQTIEDIIPIEK
jgi:hypothetical protein